MYYPHQKSTYMRRLGPLSRDVVLMVNNGTSFDEYTVPAHVSQWQERDLVPGGSMKLGDLRLILLVECLPSGLRDLEQKDRIQIDGRPYAVIHWDKHTRAMGEHQIAIEATVRGG